MMEQELFDRGDPARSCRAGQLLFLLLSLSVLPIFLITYPPQAHKITFENSASAYQGAFRLHRITLDRDGTIRWKSNPLDLTSLDLCLNYVRTIDEGVDFRPHPEVRYERFLEVLAIIRGAGIERLRIDHRAIRSARSGTAAAATAGPAAAVVPATTILVEIPAACKDEVLRLS